MGSEGDGCRAKGCLAPDLQLLRGSSSEVSLDGIVKERKERTRGKKKANPDAIKVKSQHNCFCILE